MMRLLKVALTLLAGAVASLALSSFWMNYPGRFPKLPASWWSWFDSLYGSRNAEEVADLEFLIVFMISTALVSLFMLTAAFMLRRIQRKRISPQR